MSFLNSTCDMDVNYGGKHKHKQGLIIGICGICTYTYCYWCMHNFGHAYVEMYTHFLPYNFPKFSKKFSGSYNFILVENLLLYI